MDNKSGQDRRKRARFEVRAQVVLFPLSSAGPTICVTQNISSLGFYCLSKTYFRTGDYMTCSLSLPSTDGADGKSPLELQCLVRVVRVANAEGGLFGVACKIEDFRTHAVGQENLVEGLKSTTGA